MFSFLTSLQLLLYKYILHIYQCGTKTDSVLIRTVLVEKQLKRRVIKPLKYVNSRGLFQTAGFQNAQVPEFKPELGEFSENRLKIDLMNSNPSTGI